MHSRAIFDRFVDSKAIHTKTNLAHSMQGKTHLHPSAKDVNEFIRNFTLPIDVSNNF